MWRSLCGGPRRQECRCICRCKRRCRCRCVRRLVGRMKRGRCRRVHRRRSGRTRRHQAPRVIRSISDEALQAYAHVRARHTVLIHVLASSARQIAFVRAIVACMSSWQVGRYHCRRTCWCVGGPVRGRGRRHCRRFERRRMCRLVRRPRCRSIRRLLRRHSCRSACRHAAPPVPRVFHKALAAYTNVRAGKTIFACVHTHGTRLITAVRAIVASMRCR